MLLSNPCKGGIFFETYALDQKLYHLAVDPLGSGGFALDAERFKAAWTACRAAWKEDPTAFLEWVKAYGHLIQPGTLITDVSGVKRGVVDPVQELLPEGVEFIASHPMAGRESSGITHSAEVDFAPANFIVTPTARNTPEATCLSLEEHDAMIGYVSQLCHAIAVSLMCASDNSRLAEYTGDSFRDLTRIARINEKLWAELFLWNRDNLIGEIDMFDAAMQKLRTCLAEGDREGLEEMFRLSTVRRAAFDKKPDPKPSDAGR